MGTRTTGRPTCGISGKYFQPQLFLFNFFAQSMLIYVRIIIARLSFIFDNDKGGR